MADKKISQLTGASTPLAGTEVLPIVQSGATVKVSVDNITKGKTVLASTFDTDVAAAGVTLSGTTLAADGTDTNIDITLTPKGTGAVKPSKLSVSSGSTLDGGLVVNELGADADTRIEGDTDANLLFVDASADKIGVGTNSPKAKLHANSSVFSGGSGVGLELNNANLYMSIEAGAGISRGIRVAAVDNSGYAGLSVDGMGGTFSLDALPSTGTYDASRLYLNGENGNFGIGTTTPNEKLEVAGNIHVSGGDRTIFNRSNNALSLGTNNTSCVKIHASGNFSFGTTSDSGFRASFETTNDGGVRIQTTNDDALYLSLLRSGVTFVDHKISGSTYQIVNFSAGVSLAGGGTSWGSLSDERKKDIIEPISNAVSKIGKIRSVIGKYKTDSDGTRRSFLIAQDVQTVLPEATYRTSEADDTLNLCYTDTIPLLVAAIKEQQEMIDELKGKIAALEGK